MKLLPAAVLLAISIPVGESFTMSLPPSTPHAGVLDALPAGWLNKDQILALFVKHGAPKEIAVTLGAVCLRESAGNPRALNTKPPDESYGLGQVNMFGALGVAREAEFRAKLGLKARTDLLDPDMNARACLLIWGGDNANLETAWALKLPGYKERYEVHLPALQDAMLFPPRSLPVGPSQDVARVLGKFFPLTK